jgi:hypothetical protein
MQRQHKKIRHGLTLRQWSVLVVAFMLGVGGVYVLREIFPPQTAHAAIIHRTAAHQTVPQIH